MSNSLDNLGGVRDLVRQIFAHASGAELPRMSMAHVCGTLNLSINKKVDNESSGENEYDKHPINVKILFDTGALSANYMSQDLYDDIKNQIPDERIQNKNIRIALADDSKTITSKASVTLDVLLDNETCAYHGDFVVINMKENDLIIGLPAIL